jgi:hypothetical protein
VLLQYWAVMPNVELELSTSAIRGAYMCKHLTGAFYSRGPLREMLVCCMSHCKEQDLTARHVLTRSNARSATLTFRFDARVLNSQGFAILVTKWWDLGAEISPHDPEYARHCNSERLHPEEDPKVQFESGCIQGAFEGY